MATEQLFAVELQDRVIAVLSSMLLYMDHTNRDTWEYKLTVPVALKGTFAKKARKNSQEYEITVMVKKKDT